MTPDPADDLIDALAAAEILGLSHRNSVSTYRRRYPDFPQPHLSTAGGRAMLWRRSEILEWYRQWPDRSGRSGDQGAARLNDLVEATARLMLASPGAEITVRQIAAEAGIAHSDIYRYADSKEQLVELATERMFADFRASMPATFEALLANLEGIVASIFERQAPIRVAAAALVRDPDSALAPPLSAVALAELVARHRADDGAEHDIPPEVVAASVAAMLWGWTLLQRRMSTHLGIEGLPVEAIARMARVMLEA